MAVLSKIRQRSLLLILVIGLSLLAFIVTDVIRNGGFGITRNVGSVNGDDIPAQEFVNKVNQAQERQRGLTSTMAANMIWQQEVESRLYGERIEKAGIRVGRNHVYNMYSQDPSVAQNPQFQNGLGQFDENKFNEFLVNMKNDNPEQYAFIQNNMPLVEAAAKKQLYITMVKSGFVATNLDAKAKYKLENDKVSFDYVFVPYSTINDDEVQVSDEEVTAYMKKNEKKYKAEATRDIEYVLIEAKASQQDEADTRESINQLLKPSVRFNSDTNKNDTINGFAAVTDVKEFVNKNSDIPFDTTYVSKKNLPIDHAEQLFNLPKGEVYGPYTDNGYLKVSKMMGRKPNASAKVAHILISHKDSKSPAPVQLTKEEAQAKANDILQKVNKNPDSFAELARENSDDPGSKNNGGIYDDVPPGQMVPAFDKFLFDNPVGKTGVVETDFGYHVIKVLDKYDAVQLATVAKEIRPSESTSDALFTKATKMEMDAEEKPFEDLAKELGLEIKPVNKIGAHDENIQGLGQHREIVQWAYGKDTEVGDVRKFDVAEGYVVAKLKNKNEKGLMPLEEAKNTVLPILRNEKKAALVKEKMKGDNLQAVAQASGARVASADGVTLAAPMVSGVGSEPKVVGKAFGLGDGKTSGLIEGNMGVFMVQTKSVEKAADLPNYNAVIARLKTEGRGGVQSKLTTALKENADIEDNRTELNR